MPSFNDDMHKESFYQFILYVLLREEKSNVPFKLETMLLGKQRASQRYFLKLFRGCDIPSFLHMKELFEKDYPQYPLDINDSDIGRDKNGLMTGILTINNRKT